MAGRVDGSRGQVAFVQRKVVSVGSKKKELGLLVDEQPTSEAGERVVPLPGLVVRALRDHRPLQLEDRLRAGPHWKGPDYTNGPTGFNFTSRVGTVLEPRIVNRWFDRLCERVGLADRTSHGLRHDFGGLLLTLGVQTKGVQELMGHADYAITANRYQAVPDPLQRQAMALLDAALGG